MTANGNTPPPAGVPKITLWITPDGRVMIDGPLTDKALCLLMLEYGKDLVKSYRPAIAPPPPGFKVA